MLKTWFRCTFSVSSFRVFKKWHDVIRPRSLVPWLYFELITPFFALHFLTSKLLSHAFPKSPILCKDKSAEGGGRFFVGLIFYGGFGFGASSAIVSYSSRLSYLFEWDMMDGDGLESVLSWVGWFCRGLAFVLAGWALFAIQSYSLIGVTKNLQFYCY